MNHLPRRRQKNKSRSLVRIVFGISLLLLVARLIWVLPAAFDHHRTKQAERSEAMAAPVSTPAKPTP